MGSLFSIESAPVTLTAAATKSLILVDAGVNELELVEFGVGFDAEADVAAVRVELYRVTTIGSPTGTSTTPKKVKEASGAADATALTNLTAEPTAVEIIRGPFYVRPDGGQLVIQNPLGDEETQRTATDGRIGLRVITPASVTPNAAAYFRIRE
jgi:hypothetical protein